MKKYPEGVYKCVLFGGISEEGAAGILQTCRAQNIEAEKDDVIIAEGDPADRIGIVAEGSVRISRTDIAGNESILGRAESGDIFGESYALSDEQSMQVNVIAAERSVVTLIDASGIDEVKSASESDMTRFRGNLIRIMASKNLNFNRKIEITSQRTTRGRLLMYLDIESKRRGSNEFDIPFDRQQLADYLEVDRSGLSAEIGKLRREGVLESRRSHFKILI